MQAFYENGAQEGRSYLYALYTISFDLQSRFSQAVRDDKSDFVLHMSWLTSRHFARNF